MNQEEEFTYSGESVSSIMDFKNKNGPGKTKPPKVAFLIPCTDFGPTRFWISFLYMKDILVGKGWSVTTVINTTSYPIDIKREMMVDDALKGNPDYIMWLDSDMIFDPDLFEKLLVQPPVMVSALIHKKIPPYTPTVYCKTFKPRPDSKSKKLVATYDFGYIEEGDTGLRLIDVCGTAACLIPAFYFKAIERPWFKIVRRSYKHAKVIGEDFYFCLPPNEYVYTKDNCTPIQNIPITSEVITHTGINQVHEIFERDYNDDLICIDAGYSTIKSTPNHPILTKKGWIPAEELTKSDKVFYPIPKIYGNLKELNLNEFNHKTEYNNKLKWKCGSKPNYLPEKVTIDSDLSYLLGILIAEGYVSRQTTITMHVKELNIINRCKDILSTKLGLNSTIKIQGNTTHLVITSKSLHRFLSKEIGEGARNKHLPTFWASLSKENLASLLKGYFDGDGHIVNEHSYTATTASEILARQIQEALIRLRILSSLSEKNNQYNNYGNYWNIGIPTIFRNKFLRILYKRKSIHKRIRRYGCLEETPNGFWVKIQKITKEHYTGKVYNLSVIDDNSYVVNGIAVHNCKKVRKAGLPILVNLDAKVRHGMGDATGFENYLHYKDEKRSTNQFQSLMRNEMKEARRSDQYAHQIKYRDIVGQEDWLPEHRQKHKFVP